MKAGYARLEITPGLGDVISGYHQPRISTGIRDELYATAVAFNDGETTVAVISLDLLELTKQTTVEIRNLVAKKTGLDPDAILVHATHTHTGPEVSGILFTTCPEYVNYLYKRITDAVTFAIADMAEASFYSAIGEAKGISFVRRFIMKDGSGRTNPPIGDPEILHPQGTPDENVQLVKIEREGKPDIAIVNFQTHPDCIGGTMISADFIHFTRLTLEQALVDEADGKGAKVIYFNGAQGDTTCRGLVKKPGPTYERVRHMGRVIAGGVLSVYTYAEPIECDKIAFKQIEAIVPAHASRHAFDLHITSISLGGFGFVGFPGEPYTEIGRRVKAGSAYGMTITSCNTNGWVSYIPTREAIPYGGMGVDTDANPDVEDICVNAAIELTKELKK